MNITLEQITKIAEKNMPEDLFLIVAAERTGVEATPELLGKAIYLLMKNQEIEISLEDDFNEHLNFFIQDGGYELYLNVENYADIAKLQVENDTDNNDSGSFGYIRGNLPEFYAKFINFEIMGKELEQSNFISFDKETKTAIRIWGSE